MSGFHEVRFPDNIAYGATGGPEFATTVAGIVALIMAIGRAMLPQDHAPSYSMIILG